MYAAAKGTVLNGAWPINLTGKPEILKYQHLRLFYILENVTIGFVNSLMDFRAFDEIGIVVLETPVPDLEHRP